MKILSAAQKFLLKKILNTTLNLIIIENKTQSFRHRQEGVKMAKKKAKKKTKKKAKKKTKSKKKKKR